MCWLKVGLTSFSQVSKLSIQLAEECVCVCVCERERERERECVAWIIKNLKPPREYYKCYGAVYKQQTLFCFVVFLFAFFI